MKNWNIALLIVLIGSSISYAELSESDRQMLDEDLSSIPSAYSFYTLHGPELNKAPEIKIYAEKNRQLPPVIELKNSVFWISGKPTCRLFSPNQIDFVFAAITEACPANATAPCENPKPCVPLQSFFIPFGRQGTMHAIPVQANDESAGFAELAQTTNPKSFPHPLFLDLKAWTTPSPLFISPSKLQEEQKKEAATFVSDAKLKKWIVDTKTCFEKNNLKCITQRFGTEVNPDQILLFSWNGETPFTCKSLNIEKKKPQDRKLRIAEILPCLWKTPFESLNEAEQNLLSSFKDCLTPEAVIDGDVTKLRILNKTEVLINNACTLVREANGEFRFKEFSGYGC